LGRAGVRPRSAPGGAWETATRITTSSAARNITNHITIDVLTASPRAFCDTSASDEISNDGRIRAAR
jgi:hypothetical protein